MPYELVYEPRFEDQLEALDKSFALRARKMLDKITANPRSGKGLHGRWDYFEMRFDPYRMTYIVDERANQVRLLDLDKRDRIFNR